MKQRQPTKRAHACARSHGDMLAKNSLVYLCTLVSYTAYPLCVGRGMGEEGGGVRQRKNFRGVCVWHIVWLRVEFVKRKKRGKDILRGRG